VTSWAVVICSISAGVVVVVSTSFGVVVSSTTTCSVVVVVVVVVEGEINWGPFSWSVSSVYVGR
jgi:hypothetical protein